MVMKKFDNSTEVRQWWQQSFDDNWTVSSLLTSESLRYNQRPALLTENGKLVDHGEIAYLAGILRAWLQNEAETGDAVATLLSLGKEYFAAVHAVLTSGLTYVTLDPESPKYRNSRGLDLAKVKIIITDGRYLSQTEDLKTENPGLIILNVETVLQEIEESLPPVVVKPENRAVYLTTSGSTGDPKIVVRSHRCYVHAVYGIATAGQVTRDDLILTVGSPSHVAMLSLVLGGLIGGYCCLPVSINSLSIAKLTEMLIRHPVTVLDCSPAILRLLLPELKEVTTQLRLRQIFTSGGPLLRKDLIEFNSIFGPEAVLVQHYGSSEAGSMIYGRYRGEHISGYGPLPLRTATHGCTIDIIDSEGNKVASDELGEIRIKSSYLSNGYLIAEPESRNGFGRDEQGPFFLTGDRAVRKDTGEIFIQGRLDRQFSIHGRRYEYGDIESAICLDGNWADTFVSYRQIKGELSQLIAVLQPSASSDMNIDALRNYIEQLLPPAAIPNHYIPVANLPRTASGKVDIAASTKLIEEHLDFKPQGLGGSPEGVVEKWLADCWEHLLKIPRPGRKDSFTSLGGDSLMAMHLIIMLDKRFGFQLDIDDFAEAQTIADQAVLIEQKSESLSDRDPLVLLQDSNDGPVFIILPGIGGHAWVFNNLINLLTIKATIYSLSFNALFKTNGLLKKRKDLVDEICDLVYRVPPGRPVFIGGYSLGAVIAIDVANNLLAQRFVVEKLLLLDPVPIREDRVRTRIKKGLRHAMQFVGERVGSVSSKDGLKGTIIRQNKKLRSLMTGYKPSKLPDIPISVLRSTQEQSAVEQEWLEHREGLNFNYMACGHLDCLSHPFVSQSATWLEHELAPFVQSPENPAA